jgi:hypothetical protein
MKKAKTEYEQFELVVRLIAETRDEKLQAAFLEWQEHRIKQHENFLEFLDLLLDKPKEDNDLPALGPLPD